MYCAKLKNIVKQHESIRLGIDEEFVATFDKCIKDGTTERERQKLNPIKIANTMGISQDLVMHFFNIGKKMKLFKARAFYSCECGERFEIFDFDDTECINGCSIHIEDNKDKVFIYFELLEDIEECDFYVGPKYQIDYVSSDDLGGFKSSYDEYEEVIGNEEAKNLLKDFKLNSEIEEISIIHITDLHFGSDYNTGVDNKAGLKGIDNIAPDVFESFCNRIPECHAKYLIISGDLTTKNEEEGFIEFKRKMKNVNLNSDRIYIVPGNHECDRSKSNEEGQFALFTSYTKQFKTIYSDKNYIIDNDEKLFIYGFNSVNFKKQDDKELFYIKNEEFSQLENLYKKLKVENDDFDDYIKIAVVHNNLLPHPNVEAKEYAEVLNIFLMKYKLVNLGFKLVCSGHKHQELIEKHTVYNNCIASEIVLASAPSLCGNVYNGKNGFHVIKILKDNKGKLVKFMIDRYEIDSLSDFKLKNTISVDLYD